MAESSNRPKDIFLKALEVASADERALFLAQAEDSAPPESVLTFREVMELRTSARLVLLSAWVVRRALRPVRVLAAELDGLQRGDRRRTLCVRKRDREQCDRSPYQPDPTEVRAGLHPDCPWSWL